VSEKMESKCGAKQTEQKVFEFQIPTSMFVDDEEQKRNKIPLAEKPLA
tara:strand:+ start:266 stop:409 length:144 start_codon:yes stop_codon:yes gene_type:complete